MVVSTLSTKDSKPQGASRKTRECDAIQSNSANAQEKLLNQDKLLNIALNAYYQSEARGFEPGHEIQDWLEAEAEVEK